MSVEGIDGFYECAAGVELRIGGCLVQQAGIMTYLVLGVDPYAV